MEKYMETINVEEIMKEIRADIKAKGLTDTTGSFDDIVLLGGEGNFYNKEVYEDMLTNVGETAEVLSYRELSGNPISKFIKKINRRLIAFYIECIVDDQNKFNRNVYSGMQLNLTRFDEEDRRIAMMEKQLKACEEEIAALKQQLADRQ
jgi:hypothetical protein